MKKLSKRQKQLLRLIKDGKRTDQICSILNESDFLIRAETRKLFDALKTNRLELISMTQEKFDSLLT